MFSFMYLGQKVITGTISVELFVEKLLNALADR